MKYVNLLDILYPVDSLYFSVNPISPSQIIGGSWVEIEENAMIGCGNGYSGSHTITINNMPRHTHDSRLNNILVGNTGGSGLSNIASGVNPMGDGRYSGAHWASINSTGNGQDYTPYYFGVHIWYRVS